VRLRNSRGRARDGVFTLPEWYRRGIEIAPPILTPLGSARYGRPSAGPVFGAPGGEKYQIETNWFHSGTLVFKFRGVDTISDAEALYGREVRIPASQRTPLDEGEYFQSDLLGCEVVARRTGESLGHVTAWDDGGGTGLHVAPKGGRSLKSREENTLSR